MRSILIIIITCLLFPCVSVSANSTNKQQAASPSSSERKNTQTARRDNSDNSADLDFSGTGRPGQQTAGESRGSCANAAKPLEAVIPVSHSGKTVSSHPSFWVYLPDSSQHINQIEFVLQNEAREDIWRSPKLNAKSGYKSFALPENEPALEIGQWYRWYVKVYCDSQVASTQYVQGWIERIPLTSKLYLELQQNLSKLHLTYGNHHIWYDAIDRLLKLYQSNPQSLALEQDWQAFIKAKGVQLQQLPSIGGSRVSNQ